MSVRLKRAAAELLAPTGALRVCGTVKARLAHRLLLLGYHRIVPLEQAAGHPGDLELVSATPTEFAWQVEYIARRFEPVTFAQIADALDGGPALPKRAAAITFDDGFADVHEHALPILARTGFPATVFVSTGYVGEARPFWFDLVAWIVLRAPAHSVRVPTSVEPLPTDDSDASRLRASALALKWLKRCDERERAAALAALCEQFPDEAKSGIDELGRALSWPQIREMAGAGIEFGSHTVSHRCLAKLRGAELDHELTASKATLEEQLGTPVTALAYPFGGRTAFDDEVIAAAKRAGYRVATTYIPGVNDLAAENRFALLRQHVERDTSRSYFEALVNAPEVFS